MRSFCQVSSFDQAGSLAMLDLPPSSTHLAPNIGPKLAGVFEYQFMTGLKPTTLRDPSGFFTVSFFAYRVIVSSGGPEELSLDGRHAYGGTRMGDNPETNVVDRWGLSHEVPNLGILGGSVMGTSGARNPTLTAQALAWRTAEHLVKNWKKVSTD